MSENTLCFDDSDSVELFHAFKNRGDSKTRRKIRQLLRRLDTENGRKTSPEYWYYKPFLRDLMKSTRAVNGRRTDHDLQAGRDLFQELDGKLIRSDRGVDGGLIEIWEVIHNGILSIVSWGRYGSDKGNWTIEREEENGSLPSDNH